MKQIFLVLLVVGLYGTLAIGQAGKKAIDFTHYDSWRTMTGQRISGDGAYLTWSVNPHFGDGQLFISGWDEKADRVIINRGTQATFSPGSEWVAFRINPQADSVRMAKIKKVKTEKIPKDSLGIYVFQSGDLIKYPELKSFKVAGESSPWIAFQQEEKKAEDQQPEKKDTIGEVKKEDSKPKKKPEFNGLPLIVLNPLTRDSMNFPLVTEYLFSKNGKWLGMISITEDSVKTSTIRLFDSESAETRIIWERTGVVRNLTCDEAATQVAFLFSADTSKTKNYTLLSWSVKDKEPVVIVDSLTDGMMPGWNVSENGRIYFSANGERVFFGTSLKPVIKNDEKDTLLADDKVSVDIWHWKEDVLQSIQLKRVDQDIKKTYLAVYNFRKNRMVQLAEPDFIENFRLVRDGDHDYALGTDDKPYRWTNSINSDRLKDVYLTDLNTGTDVKLFEKIRVNPVMSGEGKFITWWEPADSSWYCYHVRQKTTVNLSRGLPVGFVNEIHDTPDEPGSYGTLGWGENDEWLYLYDRYDIWKFNPEGKTDPVCITNGTGRVKGHVIRYISLDPEEKFIDASENNLFSAFNSGNKQSGFYRFRLDQPDLQLLVMDNCRFSNPVKAKNADKFIWTRSTISEYPDLWASDLNFSDGRKLSSANPQQGLYNWASVELVEWIDLNGIKHQGLLYKPENFDSSIQYPMIVYFYERHSDGLHTHYIPRASASTVNPLEYASNGYLVFMPDIHFITGNPGKSFYNAVMSGVLELSGRGFVDMENLGIQGQSWGGYGTAYLITQTNLFAAASPGAPVSNMTSAYGGIRSESGMVRQFQYEHSQSRIGGTLWEKPEYFIENSPLFFADRINTPCLIRHDDADGAVPFSEGVQLFVALRRLGKPAWLINYNNAPHNLSRQADKKDWSVRMVQFFNHYLKGEPAPEWMVKGVEAIDKKANETYYRKYTEY